MLTRPPSASGHLGEVWDPQCVLSWMWGLGKGMSLRLVWRQEDGQEDVSKLMPSVVWDQTDFPEDWSPSPLSSPQHVLSI